MDKWEKVAIGAVIVYVLGSIGILSYMSGKETQFDSACETQGGIPINAEVCLKKDNTITI